MGIKKGTTLFGDRNQEGVEVSQQARGLVKDAICGNKNRKGIDREKVSSFQCIKREENQATLGHRGTWNKVSFSLHLWQRKHGKYIASSGEWNIREKEYGESNHEER